LLGDAEELIDELDGEIINSDPGDRNLNGPLWGLGHGHRYPVVRTALPLEPASMLPA
jgi:hypothetical protein